MSAVDYNQIKLLLIGFLGKLSMDVCICIMCINRIYKYRVILEWAIKKRGADSHGHILTMQNNFFQSR